MTFVELLEFAAELPVIDVSTLGVLGGEPKALSVQLHRWARAGKLILLRKGIYMLAKPYRHREHSLDSIANLLVTPSYVSLERALSIHGLIPERVPLIQSVTTSRPVSYQTNVGDFQYRHINPKWFFGYRAMPLGDDEVLVAVPEKALLDWVHLSKGEMTFERLEELRLHDLERLDIALLTEMSQAGRPRLQRAAKRIRTLAERERSMTAILS